MMTIFTNSLNRLKQFMRPVEEFPSARLAADLIPKEWKVIEDASPSKFDVNNLMPVSFLRGKPAMDSAEMRKRAIELDGNLSLADGKLMLNQQDKIPVEFRDFYVLLPATVLLNPLDNGRYIAYLNFDGNRWYCGFRFVDFPWYGRDRFACSE